MPTCTNANDIEEYPQTYKSAVKIGINHRGWVEYFDEDNIYEVVYPVRDPRYFQQVNTHNPLGQTAAQHIENSEQRFSSWTYVCEGVR